MTLATVVQSPSVTSNFLPNCWPISFNISIIWCLAVLAWCTRQRFTESRCRCGHQHTVSSAYGILASGATVSRLSEPMTESHLTALGSLVRVVQTRNRLFEQRYSTMTISNFSRWGIRPVHCPSIWVLSRCSDIGAPITGLQHASVWHCESMRNVRILNK